MPENINQKKADAANAICNLCGSGDYTVMYESTGADISPTAEDYTGTINRYGRFHRIVSCNRCGLIYSNPRDARILSLYRKVVDTAYLDSWKERAATFRNHLKILAKYKSAGKILDIGCYAGIFLGEAKKQGYEVAGIEPSEWAADHAGKASGAKVLCAGWDEALLPEGAFDIVTMWDTVEHLEDPSGCFKKIHGWLKKDGIVAVTTHNINGWFARLSGRRYPWLMRFHLYHFCPKTLSAMMLKNGLEPIATRSYMKTFSLKYILGRLGIKTGGGLSGKIRISLNTGDMFMMIARKK